MTPTKPVLLLAASGLALGLAGCKMDNRPLLARFTGTPAAPVYADLPPPGPLGATAAYSYSDASGGTPCPEAQPCAPPPPAYPAGYGRAPAQAYPHAERAYALDRVFYQSPPAYGFYYAGEQPWAWQTADDYLMFAEPYGDAYRFYYYQPGAAYPYFVRDAEYGYAYGDNGALLALFTAAGALLAAGDYDRYYPAARGYWGRGYDLYHAYDSGGRFRVDPAVWSWRASYLQQYEAPWIAAPTTQPGWRQWRATQGARLAENAPRHDNGLHLGWERGRHEGWYRQPAPPQVAAPAQAPARQDRGQRLADAAPPHGLAAAFRGPAPQTPLEPGRDHGRASAQAAAPRPHDQGGGNGGGHRRGGSELAQAGPQGPVGGGHGQDGGLPHGRQGGGGNGHGHGPPQGQGQGGDGHEKGRGGGGGGGRGHGHGG